MQLEACRRSADGTLVPPAAGPVEGESTPSPYEDEGSAIKPLLDLLNKVADDPTNQLEGDGVAIARALARKGSKNSLHPPPSNPLAGPS